MSYLVLFKKIPFIIYRRLKASFAPVIEIKVTEIFDRLGNQFSKHELLGIFEAENIDSAKNYYKEYVESIINRQDGKWLNNFIGRTKKLNYWITPWGGAEKRHGEKYFSDDYLLNYVKEALKIKEKIVKEGYRLEIFGHITGQLLIDEKGRKRFIIWNGHKRTLSLIRLGYKKIRVEVSGGDRWNGKLQNHIIRIDEVRKWKNVKNGIYSKEEAESFFRRFFR